MIKKSHNILVDVGTATVTIYTKKKHLQTIYKVN
jgi:hypothetical protein